MLKEINYHSNLVDNHKFILIYYIVEAIEAVQADLNKGESDDSKLHISQPLNHFTFITDINIVLCSQM